MPRHLKGNIEFHWGQFAFADIPKAEGFSTLQSGDLCFVTDGLKGSETTGNGTGVLAFYSETPVAGWYSVQTGEGVAT